MPTQKTDPYIVKNPADIPEIAHYVIVLPASTYVEDGYGGGSTKYYTEYEVFMDVEKWKAEVARLSRTSTQFRASRVIPATITTTVDVQIK